MFLYCIARSFPRLISRCGTFLSAKHVVHFCWTHLINTYRPAPAHLGQKPTCGPSRFQAPTKTPLVWMWTLLSQALTRKVPCPSVHATLSLATEGTNFGGTSSLGSKGLLHQGGQPGGDDHVSTFTWFYASIQKLDTFLEIINAWDLWRTCKDRAWSHACMTEW